MSENINEGLPVPQTRSEKFLAKIAGEDQELPVPQSRAELFLKAIAENGSGGGGGGEPQAVEIIYNGHELYTTFDIGNVEHGKDYYFTIAGVSFPARMYTMGDDWGLYGVINVDLLMGDITNQPVFYFVPVSSYSVELDRYYFYVNNSLVPFVVTLTPTAQDFSGTMDKTPQEITAAHEAGQDIEFDVPSLSVKCKAMEFAVENGIIHAGAIVVYGTGGSHLLIEMLTSASDSTYQTTIYPLTPMP